MANYGNGYHRSYTQHDTSVGPTFLPVNRGTGHGAMFWVVVLMVMAFAAMAVAVAAQLPPM